VDLGVLELVLARGVGVECGDPVLHTRWGCYWRSE
jgi:hypothetical protein